MRPRRDEVDVRAPSLKPTVAGLWRAEFARADVARGFRMRRDCALSGAEPAHKHAGET